MSHFFAYMARMKLIARWPLMRNSYVENIQEHSLQVAMLAHALALIKNKYFEGTINPERVALLAMYHDASEVITGDLPTPVKYYNKEIKTAYQAIESEAEKQLVKMLPDDFQEDFHRIFTMENDGNAHVIVKAADTLSAYLKCVEEVGMGNHEFTQAKMALEKKLKEMALPEVSYFLETFVDSFSLTLDEISKS
ncbi:MAG: 5'-deoxynucleotidase [Methylococcales bacterium]|jgi:5'-deoxynucleotidase|nr:5'-deoxynucleotidase [Methylococcales bacterium]MBT7410803.1 5'-deoxynucleotidase [Methylococcales bacterium]